MVNDTTNALEGLKRHNIKGALRSGKQTLDLLVVREVLIARRDEPSHELATDSGCDPLELVGPVVLVGVLARCG